MSLNLHCTTLAQQSVKRLSTAFFLILLILLYSPIGYCQISLSIFFQHGIQDTLDNWLISAFLRLSLAASEAPPIETMINPARMPIMAMTTSNSIRVNALLFILFVGLIIINSLPWIKLSGQLFKYLKVLYP